MTYNCPKCGLECEGEDLGDAPWFISFECDCGEIFDVDTYSDVVTDKEGNKYGE